MARLLTQLFEVTAQFNMRAQPQLLLLQKTMVVVEGVARTLNPNLNMWVTAEPVVRGWIERKLGPLGKIEDATGSLGKLIFGLPAMLEDAQKATVMLAGMAQSGGLKLDAATAGQLAFGHRRSDWLTRICLLIAAVSLAVIAINLSF